MRTDKQTDGHTEGRTNGRTDKWTNIYSIFRDKLSLPEGSSDFTILNKLVTGSIIVRSMKFITVPSMPLRV